MERERERENWRVKFTWGEREKKLEDGMYKERKREGGTGNDMVYQNSNVCLYGATNHVWHKTGMARGIQNGEPLFLCFKECPANFNSLSLTGESRMSKDSRQIMSKYFHHLLPFFAVGVKGP